MSRPQALARVVAGRGILPRPSWLERILTMFDVRRTRIDLDRLTDTQLKDIGLTREDVLREMERPIWDVPDSWRRR